MRLPALAERIAREQEHASEILRAAETNWGWNTPAGRLRKERRQKFLAATTLGPAEQLRVLEIGCGTGTFSSELAATYPRLLSIDISERLLDVARSRLPSLRFARADAHRLGLPDASFDVVVACSVLHHLDWDVALRETFRVLRPGGELRASEPNLKNPQIFLQKKWPWLKRRMGDSPDETAFTASAIARSLRAAGFVEVQAIPFEFLHPSTPPSLIESVIGLEEWLERTPLRAIAGSLKITARRPAGDGASET